MKIMNMNMFMKIKIKIKIKIKRINKMNKQINQRLRNTYIRFKWKMMTK